VGDEYFQRKCYAKLNEFRAKRKTICFVSHDLAAVERLCQRGLLLDHGTVRAEGDIHRVLEAYHELIDAQEERRIAAEGPKGDRCSPGSTSSTSRRRHPSCMRTTITRSAIPFVSWVRRVRWGQRGSRTAGRRPRPDSAVHLHDN